MSRPRGFFGSAAKLEQGRKDLAARLRTLARLVDSIPAEQLADVYYDCDHSLDTFTKLVGLPLPNRQFMWAEIRDSRRSLDQL